MEVEERDFYSLCIVCKKSYNKARPKREVAAMEEKRGKGTKFPLFLSLSIPHFLLGQGFPTCSDLHPQNFLPFSLCLSFYPPLPLRPGIPNLFRPSPTLHLKKLSVLSFTNVKVAPYLMLRYLLCGHPQVGNLWPRLFFLLLACAVRICHRNVVVFLLSPRERERASRKHESSRKQQASVWHNSSLVRSFAAELSLFLCQPPTTTTTTPELQEKQRKNFIFPDFFFIYGWRKISRIFPTKVSSSFLVVGLPPLIILWKSVRNKTQ